MKITLLLSTLTLAVVVMVEADPPVPSQQDEQDQHVSHASQEYGPLTSMTTAAETTQAQYGAPFTGLINGMESGEKNEEANYEFQYDVSDVQAGLRLGHQESREGHIARGRYYVLLPDGRTQTVEYVADQGGYRPKITYHNQPAQPGGYN